MNPFAARSGLRLLGYLCAGLLAACTQPVDEVADAATATDGSMHDDGGAEGPSITTGTLLESIGEVFHRRLEAVGGTLPYTWALEPGSTLPTELSFGADGWLNGSSFTPGRWSLVVKVTDAHGRSDSKTLELVLSNPNANDRCSAPTPLGFSNGVAKVSDSLAGATPDGVASACRFPSTQPDRFFGFDLATDSNVTITVSNGFAAALYQPGCSQDFEGPACGPTVPATLSKGSYVVGVTGPANAFELTVTSSQAGGEGCEDITPLDLSTGSAIVRGAFTGSMQNFVDCGDTPDRVYSFTLNATSTVRVSDSAFPGTNRSIRTGQSCATSTRALCRLNYDGDLEAINLPAGTHYLVIGGYPPTPYSVLVTVTGATPIPVNDKCEGATPVVLVNDEAALSGNMLGAIADPPAETCGAPTSRDLYFAIDLEKTSRLQIATALNQRAQLLSGTCSAPSSLACGSQAPLCVKDLQPGRYYLRVISDSSDPRQEGGVSLTRYDPLVEPPNATCAAPESLTLKAGVATAKGTLAAAGHHFNLSCATNASELHDLVYKLTLDKRTDLKLSASAYGSDLHLAVVSGSCQNGTEVRCRALPYEQRQTHWGLAPGDYWVVVQGTPHSASDSCWMGDFTLTVTATDSGPIPENDNCTTPTQVTLDGPGRAVLLDSTLLGASNDFSTPSCSTEDFGGPDVVYDLDLQAAAVLRVSPLGSFPSYARYYLTQGCGSKVALACPSSTGAGLTTSLRAGHYYLVIDSRSDTSQPGDFSLVLDTL